MKLQGIWNCVHAIVSPHQAHQRYLLTCDIFIQEECGTIRNYRQYTSSETKIKKPDKTHPDGKMSEGLPVGSTGLSRRSGSLNFPVT